MADETIYGTHGHTRVIVQGSKKLTTDNFDVVLLSVGGNTANERGSFPP